MVYTVSVKRTPEAYLGVSAPSILSSIDLPSLLASSEDPNDVALRLTTAILQRLFDLRVRPSRQTSYNARRASSGLCSRCGAPSNSSRCPSCVQKRRKLKNPTDL